MPIVNESQGHFIEYANPHSGKAQIYWMPLTQKTRLDWAFREVPYEEPHAGTFNTVPKLAIELTSSTWDHSSKPPFSWVVVPTPKFIPTPPPPHLLLAGLDYARQFYQSSKPHDNVEITLYLFVAPQVSVTQTDKDGLKNLGLTVKVVRLDDWNSIPNPGANISIGDYVRAFELEGFIAVEGLGIDSQSDKNLPEQSSGPLTEAEKEAYESERANRRKLTELSNITATFDGLNLNIIQKDNGYGIEIKRDEKTPNLLNILLYVEAESNSKIRHHYYIGRSEGVSISAWRGTETLTTQPFNNLQVSVYPIERTFKEPYRHVGTLLNVSHDVFEPCAPFSLEDLKERMKDKNAHLFPPIEQVVSCDSLENWSPPTYSQLKRNANFKLLIDHKYLFAGFKEETVIPMVIDTVIGLIPYVGTMYDLATIAHIAATGTDFWGEKKGPADIALIASFMLLSSFGRIAKAAKESVPALGKLGRVNQVLFPNRAIISPNPGVSPTFLRTIFSSIDPVFAKAASRVLDSTTTLRYADELEQATKALHNAKNEEVALRLIKEILEKIEKEIAEIASWPVGKIYEHPAFLEASGRVLIDDIPSMSRLIDDAVEEVTDDAAAQAQRALEIQQHLQRTQKIEGIVRNAVRNGDYTGMIDDIRRIDTKVANEWVEKTRQQMLDDLTSNAQVQKAFKNYQANGGKDDIINYSLKRARGGLRAALNRRYGKAGFDFMLERGGKASKDIEEILDHPGAIEEIERLMLTLDSYGDLREAITNSKIPGLGYILEADHLLEKRVRIIARNRMRHPDDYLAILVPADKKVADALRKRGIDTFFYVHAAKTRRMNELLPQGQEVRISLQTMADAYQKYWVHEVGMSMETFQGLFRKEFSELAKDAGVGRASLARKKVNELNQSISKIRNIQNSQKVYLGKMKNRATTSGTTP